VIASFAAAALVGCGAGGDSGSKSATATGPAAIKAATALARSAPKPGEFIFTGDASPASHGPIELDGRYLVRFEQIAPEDPALDFSGQTPFEATLQKRAGDEQGAIKLFSAASRTGRRELEITGRYVLDIAFGDFPYAIRFTPRP
jgi:hypothetical protein